MDTGFPAADSRDDYARARRAATLRRLAARLRLRSGDLDVLMPFDEVVSALGNRGEQPLGLQTVELDTIVGSTDRVVGFDRSFRPTTETSRTRFERIAAAVRRGEAVPPVDLYRIGSVHFVRDGHHRVAVFRALGMEVIEARVTLVRTAVAAEEPLRMSALPLKGHARLFDERVPLPPVLRQRIVLQDPDDYALLAEGVEAWGFRWMQEHGRFADRPTVALTWFQEEFEPVLTLLREAGLHPGDSSLDAAVYLRLARERYRVLRTHRWGEEVVARLRLDGERRRRVGA